MSTDNLPIRRHSASEVLRNQKHFFQLDERLLLVFTPEQYMFINRLDFWIQQKLQTQLANGEPVKGWVEEEQRMYIFKTLKSSANQPILSWLEEFYHFSESTFTRVVKSLTKAHIVIKRDDKNKLSKDKTLWYSLDYEALDRYYSEHFIKNWQAVIVTRITWELKKWLDFNPKVEESCLSDYQRRKKSFDSQAKAEAKLKAEELAKNYTEFNESKVNEEVNEAVRKILTQLEKEYFGYSLSCQNDSMSNTKGLETKEGVKAHEQSGCQNDGVDAVKMAAALTIYNYSNITTNNDTNQYSEALSSKDYFIKGSNHWFLTPQTVVELARIGARAKDYQDIIFKTKRKTEQNFSTLLNASYPHMEQAQLNGEFWAEDLENELIKFHFAMREASRKGNPIKNPEGYFVSQMKKFWLAALDTEVRASRAELSLIQLKDSSSSEAGHFLQDRFSGHKFNENELLADLESLKRSAQKTQKESPRKIDIPFTGPWPV